MQYPLLQFGPGVWVVWRCGPFLVVALALRPGLFRWLG